MPRSPTRFEDSHAIFGDTLHHKLGGTSKVVHNIVALAIQLFREVVIKESGLDCWEHFECRINYVQHRQTHLRSGSPKARDNAPHCPSKVGDGFADPDDSR